MDRRSRPVEGSRSRYEVSPGRLASALVVALAVGPLTTGCLGFDSGGVDGEPGDVAGEHYQYVIDSFQLPTSATEAESFGFDLDRDPALDIDNAFGEALGQVDSLIPGVAGALQAGLDQALAAGDLIMLVDVQAQSLSDADDVGIRIFFGKDPSVEPCAGEADATCGRHLEGGAAFTIDDTAPSGGTLTGAIAGGVLDAGPGDLDIALALAPGTPSVPVDLIGAFGQAQVTEAALTGGRIGGGITETRVVTHLIPAIAAGIDVLVARDCQGSFPLCCTVPSVGALIVGALDTGRDCRVSRDELTPSINAFVAIDVDLLDDRGTYNPGENGESDALSAGIGFTAAPASFPLP